MSNKVTALLCGLILVATYLFGYNRAETEYQLKIATLENEQKAAVIAAQDAARGKYEEQIKTLTDALSRASSDNNERMRQLEQFRNASRDLEACNRERGELADLATTGERLLREADSYLSVLVK